MMDDSLHKFRLAVWCILEKCDSSAGSTSIMRYNWHYKTRYVWSIVLTKKKKGKITAHFNESIIPEAESAFRMLCMWTIPRTIDNIQKNILRTLSLKQWQIKILLPLSGIKMWVSSLKPVNSLTEPPHTTAILWQMYISWQCYRRWYTPWQIPLWRLVILSALAVASFRCAW